MRTCDTDFDVFFSILFFLCRDVVGRNFKKKKSRKKSRTRTYGPSNDAPTERGGRISRTFEIKMGANLEKNTKQESLKKTPTTIQQLGDRLKTCTYDADKEKKKEKCDHNTFLYFWR